MSETLTEDSPEVSAPRTQAIASHRSLPRQVIITAVATFIVAGFTFLTTRIYAQRFDPQEVSTVLLFRLYSSLMVALSVLGMPLSMLRNVAALASEPRRATAAAWSGLAMGGGLLAVVTLVSMLLSQGVADLFRLPSAAHLWVAFAALSFVQGFGTLVMYIHFSRGRVLLFAALSIAVNGLAQFLPILFFPHATLVEWIWWSVPLAALMLLPGIVDLVLWTLHEGIAYFRSVAVQVLTFGLSRMPGSLLENMFDPTIAWLVVLAGNDVRHAGYLAVGLALLRPFNPIMSAVSSALVPAAARLAANDEMEAQRKYSRAISEWSVQIGMFGALQLAIWCDVLIDLWLGRAFAGGAGTARILCLSLLPVFVAGSMRGFIEGHSVKPVNTYNLMIAYPVMIAGALVFLWISPTPYALALAYLLGRFTLGCLTLRFIFQDQGFGWKDTGLLPAFAVSMLSVLASVGLRLLLPVGGSLALMVVCVALSSFAFLFTMSRRGSYWARYLLNWR